MGRDQITDERVEGVERRFAFVIADHLAGWIHENQRGPSAHTIGVPDPEIAIVDHGGLDPVAMSRIAHIECLALGRELRRVHADDGEIVAILVLKSPQLRK